ncbi:MAG: hypothetical protein RMA76_23940 [Deltaproteobacteria bacterium]
MTGIKKDVQAKLASAGLTEKHLEEPGAHVLVTDGDDLHVLVPKSEAHAGIDKLEAEVVGHRGVIDVTEAAEYDMGELGVWRDFVVSDLRGAQLNKLAAKGTELRLFAPDVDGDPSFYASVDLAFAMMEVVGRELLAVRPIPAGVRDGKNFVEVTPKQRQVLHALLGRWVDDTIPDHKLLDAAQAWSSLQAEVFDTGVVGARALGLVPGRTAAPRPDALSSADGEGAHGMAAATVKYLAESGVDVPDAVDITWAEATIDALPNDVPEPVAMDVRNLLGRLHDAKDAEAAALFGMDEAVEPAPAEHSGQTRFAQSVERRLSQLSKGLEGYGVPAATQKRLAEQLASAIEPNRNPSLIIVAGERGSAGKPVFDLAVSIVGKQALEVHGSDLAEPGWSLLFGHNNGFPTEGDAWLSQSNLEKHRETPADHVPVVISNLAAAGSAEPDDKAFHQRDLMARIAEWTGTGTVNVFAKDDAGAAKQSTTKLTNTVFMVRWEGSQQELAEVLKGAPETAGLASRVIGLEPYAPGDAVHALVQEVTNDLAQHFGPQGCTITLDAGVERAITSAMKSLGPAAGRDLFFEQMRREVRDAVASQPSTAYTLSISKRLTTKEQEGLARGQAPQGVVPRWFGVQSA